MSEVRGLTMWPIKVGPWIGTTRATWEREYHHHGAHSDLLHYTNQGYEHRSSFEGAHMLLFATCRR